MQLGPHVGQRHLLQQAPIGASLSTQAARRRIVNEDVGQYGRFSSGVWGQGDRLSELDRNVPSGAAASFTNAPDLLRLDAWLTPHVPGYRGPVDAQRFEGGQSNPTFRLNAGSGDYVLRRKPVGDLLQSAHSVDREYRVLKAVEATDVPVPKVFALCEDDAVLGSAFYVMEYVPGRVYFDPLLPGLSADHRAGIFRSMCETIAKLHAVDPVAVGLADFGGPRITCSGNLHGGRNSVACRKPCRSRRWITSWTGCPSGCRRRMK
jgi:Phosphotransferase enzyme family